MLALTIRQPWADFIFDSGKDVENRSWTCRYRGPLMIHSGRLIDRDFKNKFSPQLDIDCDLEKAKSKNRGFIIGVVVVEDIVKGYLSPWSIDGCFHWILSRPTRLLSPILCAGNYGLWPPSQTVMSSVNNQIKRSIA